jgi:hypothetical protein
MIAKQLRIDGKPLVDGQTVTVDHVVQCFVVEIRSLAGVHCGDVQEQLRKKWECRDIQETSNIQLVHPTS